MSHSCEDITASLRVVNETSESNSTRASKYIGLDYGDNKTFVWNYDTGGVVLHTWMDYYSDADFSTMFFLTRSFYDTRDWKVKKCSLFPAVNTYSARIKGAILQEDQMDSFPLQKTPGQYEEPQVYDRNYEDLTVNWGYRMVSNYTVRNGIQETCHGSANNASGTLMFPKWSDEPTYVNATGHSNPSAGWKWWFYPEDCVWSFSKYSWIGMTDTLKALFDDQEIVLGRRGGAMGPAHLQVLWNEGNITLNSIDDSFKRLAKSITTVIRSSGGMNASQSASRNAQGVVWVNQTCVNVRWRWIAFPAAMIGLTGLFLLWIVFENWGIEKDRLWKSSFLAALFCEVDMVEKPVGKKEMASVAKSTSVSLEGESGRLRLVAG